MKKPINENIIHRCTKTNLNNKKTRKDIASSDSPKILRQKICINSLKKLLLNLVYKLRY